MTNKSSRQLRFKYLPAEKVGFFGKCSGRKCDAACEKKATAEYKFYLSFENSRCDGYISEKFFKPLLTGTASQECIQDGSGTIAFLLRPPTFKSIMRAERSVGQISCTNAKGEISTTYKQKKIRNLLLAKLRTRGIREIKESRRNL